MATTYCCDNCNRHEYAFKVIHLEDKSVVCKDCYYEAQEINGKTLMTIEDIKEASISDDTMKKKKMEYVRRLRKLAVYNQLEELDVMRDFAEKMNLLSQEHYAQDFPDLSNTQQQRIYGLLTTYTHRYFEECPNSSVLDARGFVTLTKDYKVSDYDKLLKS